MKSCYLIRESAGGGGNVQSGRPIVVRRNLALGDVVASLCVADKLTDLGHQVFFQSHTAAHCILRRYGRLAGYGIPNGHCNVNLDGAYETRQDRTARHFSEMFMDAANNQLRGLGIDLGMPYNCTPSIQVPKHVMNAVESRFSNHPKPWVFVCPRSNSYQARTIPDPIWQSAAAKINGTKFWIGMHPAPNNFVDLKAQHMDNVIEWLSVADLLVTADTGPMHIAAALGIPVLALGQSSSPELHLSDQRDFQTIWPQGNLECLNCQLLDCPKNHYSPPCQNFDPEQIAYWSNQRLRTKYSDDVSAVISIYRPDVETLNRCLNQVLPQVMEVVVAVDRTGMIPPGALRHSKIRYVTHRLANQGYGRKQNYSARHTNGKYLLLMNDDVFLEPDAVAKMRSAWREGVGMVSNLLRYPDGTIYHAGKVRAPGIRGWGHINHRQHQPDFKDVTELENCCGACVLVPRKAFYDIKGFDAEFMLYGEDDDFALRMRKVGYKILFTPHSVGIHLEHQSTQKTGNIETLVNTANALFHKKWGTWLEKNLYTIPGTF